MAIMAVLYTVSTAEGSVLMMKKMLAKEKGSKKVGANEELEVRLKDTENKLKSMIMLYNQLKIRVDDAIFYNKQREERH